MFDAGAPGEARVALREAASGLGPKEAQVRWQCVYVRGRLHRLALEGTLLLHSVHGLMCSSGLAAAHVLRQPMGDF